MPDGFFYGGYGHGHDSAAARDARHTANRASSDARRAQTSTQELEARLERLALMTEALWTIVRNRMDVTDDELAAMAREIDLSDGKLDGRVRRASSECRGCGRMVGRRHPRCLYCGAEMERSPFTDV